MGKDDKPRPTNSYSLLQMKMNEVQKSKKPSATKNSNSKSGIQSSSNTSKESLPPRKPLNKDQTSNKDQMSPPTKVNEPSSGKIEIIDPDVPDRSYGDYFCSLCDSHMNSEGMWEAHITGKRHIKNVNKGNPDSKYEDLDVESSVMHDIRNVKDPVIGLSYIHEARRKDVGAPPMYTCFLCQATCATVPLVIEHVLTMKHRMNYIRENKPDDYQLLEATNLKKGLLEPLVEEVAARLERQHGRGDVKVKQERIKQTPLTYSSKRMLDSDDDDMPRKRFDDKDTHSWKSADKPKANVREKEKYLKDVDKRRMKSLDENFDEYNQYDNPKVIYDSHTSKHISSTSTSRDLYRKEYYPRKSDSPVRYYPRSPPRESLKDTYASKIPYGPEPIRRYSRSRSPARESLKDNYSSKMPYGPEPISEYHRSRSPPREARESFKSKLPYGPDPVPTYSSSRSQEERTSRNSEKYSSPAESRVGSSEPQILKDFVQKIYTLPPEIFFKIVLLKLENLESIEVKEIDDLSLLSKVIAKAQQVLCNKLPPGVRDVIKQRMSQTSETLPRSSPVPSAQISDTISSFAIPKSHNRPLPPPPQGDFSFIKEFLDHKKSSVVQNVSSPHQTPHQSAMPYQNQPYGNVIPPYQNNNAVPSYPNTNAATSVPNNYSYNNAPPNSSGIPGLTLTEENRQSYNSYQQTPYTSVINPEQSSNYPPPYGY